MGYVRNNYGCHCYYGDSAFKRYNRAAVGDTVIFNYNSNNTYHCGGGCGGGFWSGLGMGFGMGLGNFFGGFMGGFGNMLGGFGLGMGGWGLGGFGLGGWGLGNFWGNNWGLGGTASTSGNNSSSTTTTTTTIRSNNQDTGALAGYNREIDALRRAIVAEGSVSTNNLTKISNLIERIAASAANPLDGDDTEKADDTTNYNALLTGLNDLKDGKITANVGGSNITININDKITIGDIEITSVEDLDRVPEASLKKLDQKTAIQILVKLGYIDFDSNSTRPDQTDNTTSTNRLVGKLSNHYNVLLLLQKSQVTVEVENNPTLGVRDHWISGPITNVFKDENGKISYDIDCTKTGLTGYQAQYTLTATDNTNKKFHATKKSGDVTVDSTRDLVYQAEKKPLLNNGEPVATAS